MKRHRRTVVVLVALALVAVLVAGVALTSASAEVTPTTIDFAATHAVPITGRRFTGITITSIGPKMTLVTCDARAGGNVLVAQEQRFYAAGTDGPAAVTCSWLIPASAKGTLSVRVSARTATSTYGPTPPFTWHIRSN